MILSSEQLLYLIASREKALCDQLYITAPIRGIRDFTEYLFDGMRLDEEIFEELDFEKIKRIAPLYHKTNLDQLVKLLEKEKYPLMPTEQGTFFLFH